MIDRIEINIRRAAELDVNNGKKTAIASHTESFLQIIFTHQRMIIQGFP